MGILKQSLYGLIYAAEHGVSYKDTLMVGRHSLKLKSRTLKKMLQKYNSAKTYTSTAVYAEDLFRFFGANTVDSMDYSNYEGANIIHDFNMPVPASLKNKYTCVFDGGTLEHVFNYSAAIKNCMDMTAINGHLVLHTPANNYFGHGFYQFSPELFFSLLHEQNGFSDTKIYMQNDWGQWLEVVSPYILKERAEFCCSSKPNTLMFVISKKIAPVPESLIVLQSDYVTAWDKASGKSRDEESEVKELGLMNRIIAAYRKRMPYFIRMIIWPLVFPMWLQFMKSVYYKPVKQFQRQRCSVMSREKT
jgi:hypothetical protein